MQPRNPINNFKFKNYLFEATSIVKNSDNEKYVYSAYETKFKSAGSWSFDNDTTKNAIAFCVDNISSSNVYSCKNEFLVLGEGSACGINEALVQQRKSLVSISVRQT